LVKKIFNTPESPLCDRSREHRGEKVSRRARAPDIRAENCDSAKTLVPCGFLRTAKKRSASLKSSPGKIMRAMNCIAVARATRGARAIIAHFLLTGFGVSCLLLYKLQRDARRIG